MMRWLSVLIGCSLLFIATGAPSREELTPLLGRLAMGIADEALFQQLRDRLRQDPDAPALWAWLGFAHALRGEWGEAHLAYQRAKHLNARPSFPWFPPTLPTSWLPEHGNLRPITIGAQSVWQSPCVFVEPQPASDPQRKERFQRIVVVYLYDPESQQSRQWVRWYVQQNLPEEMSDLPAVFAVALRQLSEQLGTTPRLPVNAWLFEKGNGGAFSLPSNTFFFGLLPSDRWSWWLKVAHEAGHHVVPAFGDFEGFHEPYSGGFLGERLFALWLWTQKSYPKELHLPLTAYLRRTIAAEIISAQQWLLRTQEPEVPTMPSFLGLCLYIERLGGASLLRTVLQHAGGDSWAAFQRGFQQALLDQLPTGLRLSLRVPDANTPLSSFDPVALAEGNSAPTLQLAWWLPVGQYRCTLLVQGQGVLQMRWGDRIVNEWTLADRKEQTLQASFANEYTGWQRLRFWWLSGSGKIISVLLQLDRRNDR